MGEGITDMIFIPYLPARVGAVWERPEASRGRDASFPFTGAAEEEETEAGEKRGGSLSRSLRDEVAVHVGVNVTLEVVGPGLGQGRERVGGLATPVMISPTKIASDRSGLS